MAQVNLGRVVGYSAYEVAVQEGFVGTEQEWLASLKGDTGNTGATGADGDDGTTFTPSVSAEGIISWTNDGGKPNPTSVNIKGPQGIQGPAGPAGTYTEGTGIDIDNGVLSVDTTVVALKSDLGDELPPIASGDAGKVLKVNAGETAVEWANDASQTYTGGTGIDITSNVISSTVAGVPSTSGASEGDVLTVDNRGEINWAAPSGGGSYSAGDGIAIDENDEISVDYANLDGDKIGNLVDSAWGFGKQNYMVWDGELDANCEAASNENIYEFDFSGCEDDIIGDIGPDTVTLGWSGSEEVGANTVYTWTDEYNTLTATYVTGTTNFVSMNLAADSSTYQEGNWFEFRFEVINEIPAEFLPAPELPEIQSGDAGKALVVNSLEDGVEWATVSSGASVYVLTSNAEGQMVSGDAAKALMLEAMSDDALAEMIVIKIGYDYYFYAGTKQLESGKFWYCPLKNKTQKYWHNGTSWVVTTGERTIDPYTAGTNITISNGTISAAQELPSVAGNANKMLVVNSLGTGVEWDYQPRNMPGSPLNDGDYKLVNTVDNGMSVLSWETDSGGGGSVSDPIYFETTHQQEEPFNFAEFGTSQIRIGYEDEFGGQDEVCLNGSQLQFFTGTSGVANMTYTDQLLNDGITYEGRLELNSYNSYGAVIINNLRLYDSQTGDLYDIRVDNGVLTATLWEDPTTSPE